MWGVELWEGSLDIKDTMSTHLYIIYLSIYIWSINHLYVSIHHLYLSYHHLSIISIYQSSLSISILSIIYIYLSIIYHLSIIYIYLSLYYLSIHLSPIPIYSSIYYLLYINHLYLSISTLSNHLLSIHLYIIYHLSVISIYQSSISILPSIYSYPSSTSINPFEGREDSGIHTACPLWELMRSLWIALSHIEAPITMLKWPGLSHLLNGGLQGHMEIVHARQLHRLIYALGCQWVSSEDGIGVPGKQQWGDICLVTARREQSLLSGATEWVMDAGWQGLCGKCSISTVLLLLMCRAGWTSKSPRLQSQVITGCWSAQPLHSGSFLIKGILG